MALAMQAWTGGIQIPRIHMKSHVVVCMCDPSMPKTTWEAGTAEFLDPVAS